MRLITRTSRVPLAIGGLLLAGTTMAAVPAGAAAPAPAGGGEMTTMSCSHSWSNKDADYGHVDADWLMRRSGPHTSCAALGQASDGTRIYYHCYVGISPELVDPRSHRRHQPERLVRRQVPDRRRVRPNPADLAALLTPVAVRAGVSVGPGT